MALKDKMRTIFTLKTSCYLYHIVAENISKVPLVEDVVEDGLIWQEEQNGAYSVKFGYRLWRNSQTNYLNRRVERNWGSLWNIFASPIGKHLLWRIYRDCLPSRSRLRHHYVQCLYICQLCEIEEEDD